MLIGGGVTVTGTVAATESPDISNINGGGASGAVATNWADALDVGSGLTRSNGNLTITGGDSNSLHAASDTICSAGKVYFETTIVAANTGPAVGVAIAAWPAGGAANYLGDSGSAGYWADSSIGINGTWTALTTFGAATVVCVAVDLGARKLWFRRGALGQWNDNSASHNPATGTGGYDISALSGALRIAFDGFETANSVTLNAGASAFTGTLPSGFVSWNAGNDGISLPPPPLGFDLVGYGNSLMYGTGTTGGELSLAWYNKVIAATGIGASNHGNGGETSNQIATRWLAEKGNYDAVNDVFIFEGGYNNFWWEGFDQPYVTLDFADMIDALLAINPSAKYLVMGVPAGEYDLAQAQAIQPGYSGPGFLYTGEPGRANINSINNTLRTTYGGDWTTGGHFVDPGRYLINNGSTGTGQDATDVGSTHDIVPISCRADNVHWNDKGHNLVSQLMLSVLQAKGWV